MKLSREQAGLMLEIMEAYEVNCCRQKLKKSELSQEWTALNLLEKKTGEINRKLRDLIGGEAGEG